MAGHSRAGSQLPWMATLKWHKSLIFGTDAEMAQSQMPRPATEPEMPPNLIKCVATFVRAVARAGLCAALAGAQHPHAAEVSSK